VRLEGLGQLKNPVASSGFDPATYWLVAFCLNQIRYRVPHELIILCYEIINGPWTDQYKYAVLFREMVRNVSSVSEEIAILRFGVQLNGSPSQSGNVQIHRASPYNGNLLSAEYEEAISTAPALGRRCVCALRHTRTYIQTGRIPEHIFILGRGARNQ
jgi:hypothetical protein